jgi:hypothetical protein
MKRPQGYIFPLSAASLFLRKRSQGHILPLWQRVNQEVDSLSPSTENSCKQFLDTIHKACLEGSRNNLPKFRQLRHHGSSLGNSTGNIGSLVAPTTPIMHVSHCVRQGIGHSPHPLQSQYDFNADAFTGNCLMFRPEIFSMYKRRRVLRQRRPGILISQSKQSRAITALLTRSPS